MLCIYGMTMPERSTTATVLVSSLELSISSIGTTQRAAIRTGTTKVVTRKLFFLTRVRYSRRMIIPIVCRFIVYLPSVTSLMKMSFILGISSL